MRSETRGVSLAARNPCISRVHIGIIITLTHRQSLHGRRRMAIGTWRDQ